MVGPDDLSDLLGIMEILGIDAAEKDAAAVGSPLLEVPAAAGDGADDGNGTKATQQGEESVDRLRKGLEDIFNLM